MGRLIHKFSIYLVWFLTALSLVLLILFPKNVSDAVADSLDLCVNVIIPSLFPFFIVSSIIVGSGLAAALGRIFQPVMRPLFHVPGSCACAFFLGLLSGYPVGAQTAISLYKEKLATKSEAERLLAFCNNSGPAFILGSVGIGVFNSAKIGVLLYVCHVLASVTVGFLFRFYKKTEPTGTYKMSKHAQIRPFSTLFVTSVKEAVKNILFICGFVVFFAILIRLLFTLNVLPFLGNLMERLFFFTGQNNTFFENLLAGYLEITTGTKQIGGSLQLLSTRVWQTSAILGWAGISVHCQVLSFLSGSGLSGKPYILGKLLHSVLSTIYTFFALLLFPLTTDVFVSVQQSVFSISSLRFSQSLYFSVSGAIAVIVIVFGLLTVYTLLRKHRNFGRFKQ